MSLALASRIEMIRDRAKMFALVRSFFEDRGVLEVDVPILSQSAPVDLHIDLVEATCLQKQVFLHSSPEYGMKRLLSEGVGDIYQMSHVFRDHERGSRHTVEFMMVEWYRMGFSFSQMIEETLTFARLFLQQLSSTVQFYSYKDLFIQFLGYFPQSEEERDEAFCFEIEPHLGQDGFAVIQDFLPEQAALSQISIEGFAERFEVFYKGIEIANGYHELIDPIEQRNRLEEANAKRVRFGKKRYPIDEAFLAALSKGVPDCCGVAVGFDRLMMLRHNLMEIHEASSFFI